MQKYHRSSRCGDCRGRRITTARRAKSSASRRVWTQGKLRAGLVEKVARAPQSPPAPAPPRNPPPAPPSPPAGRICRSVDLFPKPHALSAPPFFACCLRRRTLKRFPPHPPHAKRDALDIALSHPVAPHRRAGPWITPSSTRQETPTNRPEFPTSIRPASAHLRPAAAPAGGRAPRRR